MSDVSNHRIVVFDNDGNDMGIRYPTGLVIYASNDSDNGFMRVASNSGSIEIRG